jgi:hypothetical protein
MLTQKPPDLHGRQTSRLSTFVHALAVTYFNNFDEESVFEDAVDHAI